MLFSKYDIDKDYRFLSRINININDNKAIRLSNALLEKINLLHSDSDISTEKVTITTSDGEQIDLYIYKNSDAGDRTPGIVYFHGGGFFSRGDALTPKLLSEYVRKTGATFIYADYRLSLDFPYPTPLEDCYDAYKWVCENHEYLGINIKKIGVMGFSAGGALAAGVTMLAKDRKFNHIICQILLSPVTDHRQITESVKKYTDTPNWNTERNRFMWELYLRDLNGDVPYYASPVNAPTMKGLPPAFIEVAEFDPLHDEGLNYADRLTEDGVDVEINEIEGGIHMSSILLKAEKTKKSIELFSNFFKKYL